VLHVAATLTVASLATIAVLATNARAAGGDVGQSTDTNMSPDNPFAQPSALAYEFPPFDRVRDADYRPAFIAGMTAQLAEAAAIASDPQPPSLENTIVALERSGTVLTRVARTFFNQATSNSDAATLQLESEMAPKLAAHQDAIHLNPALFARIETLYRERSRLQLNGESRQLLERYHTEFVRAGARLAEPDKVRLRQFNEQLSSLSTQFRQNLLQASRDSAVVVDQVSQLEGLSSQQIDAAAAAAKTRNLSGRWLIALENTTTQPVLAQLKDRALRERIYRASIDRARAIAGLSHARGLCARGQYRPRCAPGREIIAPDRRGILAGRPNGSGRHTAPDRCAGRGGTHAALAPRALGLAVLLRAGPPAALRFQ
jgi:peptidyl-dipeptidase Dcp